MAGVTATISVSAFRADWMTHMPMRGLCERYTITRDQVVRLAVVWELPRRHDRKLRQKPERQRDPTQAQIRAACERIQAGWDDLTREARRVTKTARVTLTPIEVPEEMREYLDNWNEDAEP